uniref:Uncharacterized protein n=1 Tax=Manihot esculenta TaxID=3983 RepID=A0A2C9VNA8_MANES
MKSKKPQVVNDSIQRSSKRFKVFSDYQSNPSLIKESPEWSKNK